MVRVIGQSSRSQVETRALALTGTVHSPRMMNMYAADSLGEMKLNYD